MGFRGCSSLPLFFVIAWSFQAAGALPHEELFSNTLPEASEFYARLEKSVRAKVHTPTRQKKLEGLFAVYQKRFIIPFATKYSWGIPTSEAIAEMASYSPIVEIGAGNGYWAHLLRKGGVQITAFDNFSLNFNDENKFREFWSNVLPGNEKSVLEHQDKTLFLCWPQDNNSMAADILSLYEGQYLIYLGEARGGATANEDFFDQLEKDFILTKSIKVPNWPGYSDRLNFYKRKRRQEKVLEHSTVN